MEDHKSNNESSAKSKKNNKSMVKYIRLLLIVVVAAVVFFAIFGGKKDNKKSDKSNNNSVVADPGKMFDTDIQGKYDNLCDKFTKNDAKKITGGDIDDKMRSFSSQFSSSSIDLSCNYVAKNGDNSVNLYLGVRIYPDMATAKPLFDEDKKTATNAEDIDDGGFYDPTSRKATVLTDKYWLTAQLNTNEENAKDKVVDALKELKKKY